MQTVCVLPDCLLQFRKNPAVQFAALCYRQLVLHRIKRINVSIGHKETVHVPELIHGPAHQHPLLAESHRKTSFRCDSARSGCWSAGPWISSGTCTVSL